VGRVGFEGGVGEAFESSCVSTVREESTELSEVRAATTEEVVVTSEGRNDVGNAIPCPFSRA